MKKLIITEQQLQQIAAILLELPAKTVINAVDMIRNLPILEQDKLEKE